MFVLLLSLFLDSFKIAVTDIHCYLIGLRQVITH